MPRRARESPPPPPDPGCDYATTAVIDSRQMTALEDARRTEGGREAGKRHVPDNAFELKCNSPDGVARHVTLPPVKDSLKQNDDPVRRPMSGRTCGLDATDLRTGQRLPGHLRAEVYHATTYIIKQCVV